MAHSRQPATEEELAQRENRRRDLLVPIGALSVEGDMAAVVALRNAVDGADISLTEDLLRPLGPLGAPARGLLRAGIAETVRNEADLDDEMRYLVQVYRKLYG